MCKMVQILICIFNSYSLIFHIPLAKLVNVAPCRVDGCVGSIPVYANFKTFSRRADGTLGENKGTHGMYGLTEFYTIKINKRDKSIIIINSDLSFTLPNMYRNSYSENY